MSTIRVDTIVDSSGSGPVDFETIGSLKLGADGLVLNDSAGAAPHVHKMIDSSGAPYPSADSGAYNGLMWYDSANERINVWVPVGWRTFGATKVVQATPFIMGGDRAIMHIGWDANANDYSTSRMEYYNLDTYTSANYFGTLNTIDYKYVGSAWDPNSYGLFAGGRYDATYALYNYVRWKAIATTGNAASFGSLDTLRNNLQGVSDTTRAVFCGGGSGTNGNTANNQMQYYTISTSGTTTDFGDLTATNNYLGCNGIMDGTYGLIFNGNNTNIDYITIQTTANATSFGSTPDSRNNMSGGFDGSRGILGGGPPISSAYTTYYVEIQTPANATNFGDLNNCGNGARGGQNNGTIANFAGGYDGSDRVTSIDSFTVQTPGNATSFGNLTVKSQYGSACSGSSS